MTSTTDNAVHAYSTGSPGSTRALTAGEHASWVSATRTWTSTPPWTERVLHDNRQVMTELVALYEDGVSLPDLAAAAGWAYPRTNGMLHRARRLGLTTGVRRYIPTQAAQRHATKEYCYRDLTDAERTALTNGWNTLPFKTKSRSWKNPDGDDLLNTVEQALAGRVSLAKIAAVFGMSRQALHQQLTNRRNQS